MWLVSRKKVASLKANLGGGQLSIQFFSYLPLSGKGPDMTEILLSGTLMIRF